MDSLARHRILGYKQCQLQFVRHFSILFQLSVLFWDPVLFFLGLLCQLLGAAPSYWYSEVLQWQTCINPLLFHFSWACKWANLEMHPAVPRKCPSMIFLINSTLYFSGHFFLEFLVFNKGCVEPNFMPITVLSSWKMQMNRQESLPLEKLQPYGDGTDIGFPEWVSLSYSVISIYSFYSF